MSKTSEPSSERGTSPAGVSRKRGAAGPSNRKPKRGQEKTGEKPAGFLRFLFSRYLYISLLLALGVLIIGVLFTTVGLKRYTLHDRYITVPDYRGKTMEQIAADLTDRELRFEVSDSSVYDPNELALTILDHDPAPGREVKRNRKIYFTVNASQAPLATVPDVVETTLRGAVSNLRNSGFIIGEYIYKPYIYDDVVLALQDSRTDEAIEAGIKLPKGTVIDIVVGDGYGNTRLLVPDLVGATYEEARFILGANNLVEGSIRFEDEVSDTLGAYVSRQRPDSGPETFLKEGSLVDLWLSAEYIERRDTSMNSLDAQP